MSNIVNDENKDKADKSFDDDKEKEKQFAKAKMWFVQQITHSQQLIQD